MLRVCCCCRLRDLITRYAIAATSSTESLRDTEGILLAAENAEALAADMRDELRRVWGRAIRAEMVATVSTTACRRRFLLLGCSRRRRCCVCRRRRKSARGFRAP